MFILCDIYFFFSVFTTNCIKNRIEHIHDFEKEALVEEKCPSEIIKLILNFTSIYENTAPSVIFIIRGVTSIDKNVSDKVIDCKKNSVVDVFL